MCALTVEFLRIIRHEQFVHSISISEWYSILTGLLQSKQVYLKEFFLSLTGFITDNFLLTRLFTEGAVLGR